MTLCLLIVIKEGEISTVYETKGECKNTRCMQVIYLQHFVEEAMKGKQYFLIAEPLG